MKAGRAGKQRSRPTRLDPPDSTLPNDFTREGRPASRLGIGWGRVYIIYFVSPARDGRRVPRRPNGEKGSGAPGDGGTARHRMATCRIESSIQRGRRGARRSSGSGGRGQPRDARDGRGSPALEGRLAEEARRPPSALIVYSTDLTPINACGPSALALACSSAEQACSSPW